MSKHFHSLTLLVLAIIYTPITATDIDSSFSVKWQTIPWGSGGLYPAGPP